MATSSTWPPTRILTRAASDRRMQRPLVCKRASRSRTGPARRIAMSEKSQWQPRTPLTRDPAYDKAQSADSAPCEDQTNEPFFYANPCLGFFPVGPLDFRAFAKGQLIAMAIFVPVAIVLFIFCAS